CTSTDFVRKLQPLTRCQTTTTVIIYQRRQMERDRVVRAIEWAEGSPPGIRILDQTLLPGREQSIVLQDVDALVEAIQSLAVRGAPALGAAGGLGVVLALVQGAREKWSEEELLRQIERVRSARPTAVNLAWGVDRVEAV